MTTTQMIPLPEAEASRRVWQTPAIQVLDLNKAAGATVGPLCDKFGSTSATLGNDSCTVMPKP